MKKAINTVNGDQRTQRLAKGLKTVKRETAGGNGNTLRTAEALRVKRTGKKERERWPERWPSG